MLSNTDVVLFGRESQATPPALYIFSAGGQYKRTLPHVCKHETSIKLLAMNIQGQEYLCVACMRPPREGGCGQIYAINMENDSVNVAYQRDGHYPGNMCTGPPGVIYVHHCVKGEPILQLDCSRRPFTHTRTIESGMKNMFDMCYSSNPQPMLVFSDHEPTHIRAISLAGAALWDIKTGLGGMSCRPDGVTITNDGQYVIICDSTNKRFLFLRGRDGKLINTQHIDNCDIAVQPHLINNDRELVMTYINKGIFHIALYTTK